MERIQALKQLIKEQGKYNVNEVSQNTQSIILNEKILKQNLPVTQKLEEIKETSKELTDSINQKLNFTQVQNKISYGEYEPFFIQGKVINKNIKNVNTIKPFFEIKEIKGKQFQVIKINNTDFVLFKNNKDDVIYIFNHDIAPEKYLHYEYTDELENLILGNGSDDVNEINKYFEILKESNNGKLQKSSKYIKELKEKIKTIGIEEQAHSEHDTVQEGKGFEFLPSDPIDLFMELNKLKAAKKAGHNNVDDKIKFILNHLLKNKFISTDYYRRSLD